MVDLHEVDDDVRSDLSSSAAGARRGRGRKRHKSGLVTPDEGSGSKVLGAR